MIEIQAPNSDEHIDHVLPRIFLAGSIEMGVAENWQTRVTKDLADYDVVLLNPRRDDWDSSWKQSIDDPQFNKQVSWELNGLETASFIIFYFDPSTKSPITLMELGLEASSHGHLVVCCPEGFWRKGNVEMVCDRYAIPLYDNYDAMITHVKDYLGLYVC